jgi:hypothetical protein
VVQRHFFPNFFQKEIQNNWFLGPPLPLISDIRKSEVSEGVVGTLLEALGVIRKFERVVTLYAGPNRRSNRYLVHQYNRLIKSINGTPVKGNKSTPAHVVWEYNFYHISKQLKTSRKKIVIENNKMFESKVNTWMKLKDHIKMNPPVKSNSTLTNSTLATEDDKELVDKRKLHKQLKKKARTFWGIALQLLRGSHAFRTAVILKSLGKSGKWFHRDIDLWDLWDFNFHYQSFADKFSSKVGVRRQWINTEQRDKSFKWRPLGISPIPWRIYTRGLNNILEVFLSNGWPKNQHGYKSGRGINTAWNQVLHTIIKAKYIFEFDFAGFFNTVRIEAVGNILNQFYVPKYMVGYIVTMASGDVENIDAQKLIKLCKTTDPTKQGWAKAWTYINLEKVLDQWV